MKLMEKIHRIEISIINNYLKHIEQVKVVVQNTEKIKEDNTKKQRGRPKKHT
jgi:hypothetical protein